MGEKHAVLMVGFTTAALVAAFGVNLLVRQRNCKRLVEAESLGENRCLKYRETEEPHIDIIASETYEDHQEETCSIISEPPSEALSIGTGDHNYEAIVENLVELRELEKAEEKKEMERLSSCMKELEERVMMLSMQEAEIGELKKRVKEDEEKIEKLNLHEAEIIELKKKIKKDENQIQQLQEEIAMLKDKKTPKKNWWNKDASIHHAAVPVNSSKKNKWK